MTHTDHITITPALPASFPPGMCQRLHITQRAGLWSLSWYGPEAASRVVTSGWRQSWNRAVAPELLAGFCGWMTTATTADAIASRLNQFATEGEMVTPSEAIAEAAVRLITGLIRATVVTGPAVVAGWVAPAAD